MSVPSFKKGDRVIYPHHGGAKVEKREKVQVDGKTHETLVLQTLHQESNMQIRLPVDSVEQVGIRWPISAEDTADLLDVLRQRDVRATGGHWSRQFKNHQENLKSGDPYLIAETVRNLWLKDRSKGESGRKKGLSPAEKKLIAQAMRLLVSEVSLSLKIKLEEAQKQVEEALA